MTFALILLVNLLLVAAVVTWQVVKTRKMARAAEQAVPRAGQIVKVRGGAIHYVDRGPRDAPVLLCIHGLGGYLQHFTYGIADLLQDDFRLIMVDRPGCGYSERASDDLAAPREQARMIAEAMDGLGVKAATVVGHSLGGMVTLAMALDRPDLVKAMALICPLTRQEKTDIETFKGLDISSPALRRMLAHTVAVPIAAKTGVETLNGVFAPEPWPEDFVIRAGGMLGMRPESFIASSADYVWARDTSAAQEARYAGALKVPGGILFGADDALLSPGHHGEGMVQYGLSYEALPGRGHMINITAPAECAGFIRRMAAKAS
ncbi:alpha/beta fold hydrolase [Chachezhania sediminis]|uniref:alpha/beta fold hydrolase n=1 Tax=Chachezhania sediminis TaxID=2599291 RepID=UPI00131C55AE|nr:alpha/beta hydrolase [Chachezhania sediminis]